MKRRLTFRRTIVSVCCITSLGIASLGMDCAGSPPGGFDPTVPPGNRPPSLIITNVTTPQSEAYFAQQGDPVTVSFSGADGEDVAVVRVFASTASNPTPSQEIPISAGFPIGPGSGSGSSVWDTSSVALGSYQIFAEIDDRTFDPATGLGNPAVRVAAPQPLLVAPVGTAPENGAPTLFVELPLGDAGVTNKDVLTLRFDVKDPNSDEDDIALTYYFDNDRNASNDDIDPPLEVGSTVLSAGFAPKDTLFEVQTEININLNTMPIRRQTDEGGRPLPYYVRVKADDGNGGVVNAYASGAVRIVSAPSDVVDLLTVGSTVAGATFQGFYGRPTSVTRGSRAGSSFAAMGDIDSDGMADFAIGAQAASPFNYSFPNVGEAYIIYGRQRTPDPDLLATGFAQGRLSGVIGLSTVGTFKTFPPTDDRYRSIFNVRGNIIPGSQTGPWGSLGFTSLAKMPNITSLLDDVDPADDTPELLIGLAYADSLSDREDGDPCDNCSFDNEDVYPPYVCYTNATALFGEDALEATVDLPFEGLLPPDFWSPSDPPSDPPVVFNVDLGLADERIVSIRAVTVVLSGERFDQQDLDFSMDIQFESADGPLFTGILIPVPPDPGGGDPDGAFEEVTIIFLAPDPEFPVAADELFPPSIYDGMFNLYFKADEAVELTDITVRVDAITVEPEEHDLRLVNFDYEYGFPSPYSTEDGGCNGEDPPLYDPIALSEVSPACPPMNRSFLAYLDAGSFYPDGVLCEDLSLDVVAGINSRVPDGINPNSDFYQSGFVFVAANDNMVLRRDPLTGRYLGAFQGTAEAKREVRIIDFLQRFGQPFYLWQGSEGLRGARFRGAWYNPGSSNGGVVDVTNSNFPTFDATSLFGYTVDSMPEMSSFGDQTIGAEMIMSAPGQGLSTLLVADSNPDTSVPEWWIELTSLEGNYSNTSGDPPAEHVFDYGTVFSRVNRAYVVIFGEATNIARMRFYFGEDAFGDDIAPRDILLWEGAGLPPAEGDQPGLGFYEVFSPTGLDFTGGIAIPLPRAALELLSNGQGTVYAKILDDCAVKDSTVSLDLVYLAIDDLEDFAQRETPAIVSNVGAMYIVDGWDWTRNLEPVWGCGVTDGDEESDDDRPMSWPSTTCVEINDSKQRAFCYPTLVSDFFGEAAGDAFGWGRSAGDVGGGPNGPDGNPDIACGAPLSDNDPWNPDLDNCPPLEATPLTDNGKVYLIYGSQTLANSDHPCAVERFEIRGTHDDDQFGRCQGAAGDMNGDGDADFFFAAEGYDADGTGGVPSKGADVGFVGVVFASTAITGERTIRAEQVGTANFLGCKFIGGTPGARLGGGDGSTHVLSNLVDYFTNEWEPLLGIHPLVRTEAERIIGRGQYGVSSAGDFNIDGFDDLLITAPGQTWPGARILFNGAVVDGSTVRINSITFEFDTNGAVSAGNVTVSLSDASAEAAQEALLAAMSTFTAETLGVTSVRAQSDFPDPLPDIPTITFISRRADSFVVSSVGVNLSVTQFTRQGVAYLVFGSNSLLQNKTFVLPDDLNRRVNGKRILKGIVFVSAYEKNTGPGDATPDQAAIEVVSTVGDVDGDGFVDIILGAPQADFINILAPDQRRQASGDAYLLYGNGFGLNSANQN